ncbi:hypothetical protein EOM86_05775 [Candidatus Nomurabacteria bacterium]|nr:hypothetical protein [Candidatus Nomurabacteria bacterium]
MRSYLRNRIVDESRGIHPISDTDAEIIDLVLTCLSDGQHQEDIGASFRISVALVGILSKYKIQPDAEVLAELRDYMETSIEPKLGMIRVGHVILVSRDIRRIDLSQRYDFARESIVYEIMINKSEKEDKSPSLNVRIEFDSFDAREAALMFIESELSRVGIKINIYGK